MPLGKFFKSCFSLISRRSLLFVVMNTLYFSSITVGAFLAQFQSFPSYEWDLSERMFSEEWGLPVMISVIFLSNLVVSALSLVTLTGLAFFALPVVVLSVRAIFWGALLNQLSTPRFFLAFPTLVLEGEGYILASLAGVILGLSWLKPGWAYGGEGFSRLEAFKMAWKDCMRLYVLVMLLLFLGAVVEAVTIAWLA
jgi:hypothetical protein